MRAQIHLTRTVHIRNHSEAAARTRLQLASPLHAALLRPHGERVQCHGARLQGAQEASRPPLTFYSCSLQALREIRPALRSSRRARSNGALWVPWLQREARLHVTD